MVRHTSTYFSVVSSDWKLHRRFDGLEFPVISFPPSELPFKEGNLLVLVINDNLTVPPQPADVLDQVALNGKWKSQDQTIEDIDL